MEKKFDLVRDLCSNLYEMDKWFVEDHIRELKTQGYTIIFCGSSFLKAFRKAGFKFSQYNSLNYKVEV